METAKTLAVHCAGVTKIYGTGNAQVTALRGIDLDVYAGEPGAAACRSLET